MDDNRLNDNEIVELLKDSNTREEAFRQLYKRYSNRLYFIIRRLVLLHNDANDILQDVFVNVVKNISQYSTEISLSEWLCKIAIDKTMSFLGSKNQTYSFAVASYEEESAEKLSSDELFEGNEIQLNLQKSIATLPIRQRIVFVLNHFCNMELENMSVVLNAPSDALMAMCNDAQQKINFNNISISNTNCFKVPEGYFDSVENEIAEKLSTPTEKHRIDILKPYIYLAIFIAALYGIVWMYVHFAA